MAGCPGWESVNPLCRAGEAIGSAGKAAGNDVFGSIADYFAGVANAAVSWLWQQLDDATSIDLTAANIKGDLIATGSIAALVTFALFLIQVISAALRQEPAGLGRAVRGVGVAFLGAAFAVAATQLLLAAVDALCDGVVQFALGTDVQGMGSKLIVAATLASIGNPAGLLLISLVLIGAVVVVWVALMIRKMLIIVAAVFAPVAFSGAASDMSRSWVRKWIELTLALVFSKLILVIIFMIGLSVLDDADQGSAGGNRATSAVTNLVIGALTLLLAGFAPWIAIKLVHFAGDSFHAVHAQAATVGTGARSAVAAPQKVTSALQRPMSLANSARGSGSSAAGQSGPQAKSQPSNEAGGAPLGAAGGGPAGPGPTGGPAGPVGSASGGGGAAGLVAAAVTVSRAAGELGRGAGRAAERAVDHTQRPESPATMPSASPSRTASSPREQAQR